MKRVLAFVTICCLAATASAGLILTVNGVTTNETTIQIGGELTIGVVNDSSFFDSVFLIMPWGQPGEWIMPQIQPGPGPIVTPSGWEYVEWGGIGTGWMWHAAPVIEPIPAGILGEFGYRCTGLGDTSIGLFDDSLNPFGQLTIQQIPEPATLALFGFGMLLVRRRNRCR